MLDEREGERAAFLLKADFGGEGFAEEFERACFAAQEAERFQVQQLHVGNETKQNSEAACGQQAEGGH